jgi:hypothetical protein
MPAPNYFAPKKAPPTLSDLTGGMNPSEVRFEIERGARFVIFQYTISLVVVTFRRNSKVVFIKPGESPASKSLAYTTMTLLLGWWGIPWGFIYTPQVLYKNLRGGTDVTPAIRARLDAAGT